MCLMNQERWGLAHGREDRQVNEFSDSHSCHLNFIFLSLFTSTSDRALALAFWKICFVRSCFSLISSVYIRVFLTPAVPSPSGYVYSV